MVGALKVQTAPGVWTTVGGQGPPSPPQDVLHVGTDAPVDPTVEMWWDSDEPAPTMPFVNKVGDAMTGPLLINVAGSLVPVTVTNENQTPTIVFNNTDGTQIGYVGCSAVTNTANLVASQVGSEVRFFTGGTAPSNQRVTIDTNGTLLIRRTVHASDNVGHSMLWNGQNVSTTDVNNAYPYWGIHISGADAASVPFATWRRGTGTPTQIGSVTQVSTTGVAYNTTSHGPFKGNVADIEDNAALVRVERWRPVTFQWKLDEEGNLREDAQPTGDEQTGFVAQELVAVEPGAVTEGYGTQAEWDEWAAREQASRATGQSFDEAEPFMPWQTDNSALVPALVAAVRALIHKVAALEGIGMTPREGEAA